MGGVLRSSICDLASSSKVIMKSFCRIDAAVLLIAVLSCLTSFGSLQAQSTSSPSLVAAKFAYAAGPPDNPLKGLVPYQHPHEGRFPSSMEFNYLPLSAIVKGDGVYDWNVVNGHRHESGTGDSPAA